MSLLRKISRIITGSGDAEPDASLSAQQSNDPEEPRRRRRRGRRGGRGRGRGNGAPAADTAPTTTTNTTQERTTTQRSSQNNNNRGRGGTATADRDGRGRGERDRNDRSRGERERSDRNDRSRGERERSDRNRGERDRNEGRRPSGRPLRSRPRRGDLEPPLPEDVAFRPVAEGGDNSLLPGRRRRPPGPKTTNRVVVSSPRYLPSFLGRKRDDESPDEDDLQVAGPDAELLQEHELDQPDRSDDSDSSAVTSEQTSDETPEESRSPRRRGRRGGRGRRASNGSAPDADAASSRDDEDQDDGDPRAESPQTASQDPPRADRPPRERPRREEPRRDEPRREQPRRERPAAASPPDIEVNLENAPQAFVDLGFGERSLAAVMALGFDEPTPVQTESIPLLLNGRDVVGIAQTGTGKTLAFGIPMMERVDPRLPDVQAIVLVPTRELAQQVFEVLTDLAKPFGTQVIALLGGRALDRDFRELERRPQIVVGTPGRVKDHLGRGTLSLRRVSFAVLDEADQMLDIGFLPDITHILGRTPRRRQTALFSATMPTLVRRIVKRYMDEPATVEIAPELMTVETIDQIYFEVAQRDKLRGLRELIDRELRGRTLIFSRTKRGVDFVADQLQGMGVRVGALHGDMDQRRRDRVVQSFREGELDVLIATNVAARGLDIPEITHVVNYDVPQNAEEYVHRIGRTGRAGREGKAITFVCEYDMGEFDTLLEAFGDRLHAERLELYA